MTEYYVNITDKPITDLDAVQFRLKCGETDTVCVLNNTDWNTFSERITQIEEENETLITEQIRDVIRRLQEGTEPVAYSDATGSMKKLTTQEVISFDDVKNNLSDVNTLKTTIQSLPNKLEKTSSNVLNNSNTNTQENSKDGWKIEYGVNSGSCIVTDSTITMTNFVGNVRFPVGANNVKFRLKVPNKNNSSNILYGEDDDTVYGFTQNDVWQEITIDKNSSLVIESFEMTNVVISYEMYVYHNEINAIADIIYPIGAVYMSTTDVSPSILFGGNWERLKNRFLLGAGTYSPGATGGSTTVSLTESQMPRHTHIQPGHKHKPASTTLSFLVSKDDIAVNFDKRAWADKKSGGIYYAYDKTSPPAGIGGNTTTESVVATNNYTGGTNTTNAKQNGASHENMPPYLVVYMWKRTE